jgi:aspartate aminotransferase-like enzyme
MKLFTVGPVQMYPETLKVSGEQIPYFRTDEFSEIMLESDRILKEIMGTSNSSKCIYLTASGSGAMEATVLNCFSKEDKLLIINGGNFGQFFVDICKINGIPHEIVKLEYDEELQSAHLERYDNKGFTGLLVNLHETSTGQLYDVALLSEFCRRNNMYFVVDAISTFLADPYDMDKYHIDATIISSQKGLCLSPGLSMVMLSERMVERVRAIGYKSFYFGFEDYLVNFERGQTPHTPCVGILLELNETLNRIKREGLESRLAHVKTLSSHFRKEIQRVHVAIPAYPLSNAITPIFFEKNISKKMFDALKNEYGIFVNPASATAKEREKQIKVAHIGNLKIEDNVRLVDTIETILNDSSEK